jgi:hypothetical protein
MRIDDLRTELRALTEAERYAFLVTELRTLTKGRCSSCNRLYVLREDGQLPRHTASPGQHCYGHAIGLDYVNPPSAGRAAWFRVEADSNDAGSALPCEHVSEMRLNGATWEELTTWLRTQEEFADMPERTLDQWVARFLRTHGVPFPNERRQRTKAEMQSMHNMHDRMVPECPLANRS